MTIDSNTIGFGLVGAGMIANYHAKAIEALSAKHNIRLAGVLGLTMDEALCFAQKHNVPFHTDDAKAFFARPDIQVVCIVTPSGAHLEPALQAIHAGKHLIVEKPLEITVERVDAMLDAASKAGVKLPQFPGTVFCGELAPSRTPLIPVVSGACACAVPMSNGIAVRRITTAGKAPSNLMVVVP